MGCSREDPGGCIFYPLRSKLGSGKESCSVAVTVPVPAQDGDSRRGTWALCALSKPFSCCSDPLPSLGYSCLWPGSHSEPCVELESGSSRREGRGVCGAGGRKVFRKGGEREGGLGQEKDRQGWGGNFCPEIGAPRTLTASPGPAGSLAKLPAVCTPTPVS